MVWVEKNKVSFHITRVAKDSGKHVWVGEKERVGIKQKMWILRFLILIDNY